VTAVLAAVDRTDIAAYLNALVLVYSILIVVHVLAQMIFSLGGRVPYSRWSDAILGFLRDVCEPYLSIFRRFIPMVGPVDISPIVALVVLYLVGGLVVRAIHG
jgi:YggT family protein